MKLQTNVPDRLLTWLDVERLLKQHTELWTQLPASVMGVDCFASGIEIRHVGDENAVDVWLTNIFGAAYRREPRFICLCIGDSKYPVDLIAELDSVKKSIHPNYPLWRDVAYIRKEDDAPLPATHSSIGTTGNSPAAWKTSPDLISFHSFKGGVGRTTTLMTYVAACMEEPSSSPKKILVVDADFEAPGVSFWLDEANRPTVSFVQLLEALHYPPAGTDQTLDFFAKELRKTSFNVGGLQRELFVLPAALDLAEIQDMPVTPEHLARNPTNPWQLSDHLHALGARLGADAVFIDLRAGLSELASPILFDPRVDHFFVSTVAPQSVYGMAEVLNRLYSFNRRLSLPEIPRPTMVLSLLTKELRETGHYELALNALNSAYPTDDALTAGVQWLEAEFLSNLMSIGSVREALSTLPKSNLLFSSAAEWAKALYATPVSASTNSPIEKDASGTLSRQQQAKKLYEVCKAATFADSTTLNAILATEPLLNLGKHYANELPNLLMIGAKGAGKTFTFRQLVGAGSWAGFLAKLGFDSEKTTDAVIFPALWSDNIPDRPEGEIKVAQIRTLDLFQTNNQSLLSASVVQRSIKEALIAPPTHWEDFWDGLIANQFNISGGLVALNQALHRLSMRVVIVFDGIEDAFKDVNDGNANMAINALLRLPNRLAEMSNQCLGAVVFVREDYVQATINQNLGQWLQRYHPFRLHWNPESFLRLACMLSRQAGIHSGDEKPVESLRIEELKTELDRLWGRKLGGEKSKEAHSARWVYAALCDLKGNVQARDLVRFLKFAAEIESMRAGQTWPERTLAPESMRKAIPECSIEKVTEAKSEIAPLRKWTELMAEKGVSNLRVPFSQEEALLEPGLLASLKEIGVIYEDLDGSLGAARLYLPEIYRYGLTFETSSVGRPRTQALLKKNIGSIPL